jgi:hypothetical protein
VGASPSMVVVLTHVVVQAGRSGLGKWGLALNLGFAHLHRAATSQRKGPSNFHKGARWASGTSVGAINMFFIMT